MAALAGLQISGPAFGAEEPAPRPDLLITQAGGEVLSLLSDDATPALTATAEGGAYDSAIAPNGDLWIAARTTVVKIPANGDEPTVITGYGLATGVVVTDDGTVYVADYTRNAILSQPADGSAPTVLATVLTPSDLSLTADGNLLAPTYTNGTVATVSPTGEVGEIAADFSGPWDAEEDADGSIVVSDYFAGSVVRVSPDQAQVEVAARGIDSPTGIELGSGGEIYVNSFNEGQTLVIREGADGPLVETVATGLSRLLGLTAGAFELLPAQTITFTSTAPDDATVGDTYTPTATGGESGNPVTFSIAESTAEVCSIDAETDEVTFDAPGTCTIAADQAGDDEHADAEQVTQDVVVSVPELFITSQVTSELPANEAGWYRTPATITYTCGGGTAPLACPDPVTRANTQADFRAFAKVTDAEGRIARVRTPMKVDTTAPQLTITTTGSGPYARKARPIRCTATDKHSGVDGTCTVTYGRVVQGPKGGATRRWTATATDVAGNTKTVSKAFRVKGSAPARPTMPGIIG